MTSAYAVTLDSLERLHPGWSAKGDLYAVVDMGSNGIRFSILSLAPPRSRLLSTVYKTKEKFSLFDKLRPSPNGLAFSRSTIQSVASIVSGFYRLSTTAYHVEGKNFRILATEAMRRATNAQEMIDAIEHVTGDDKPFFILDPTVEILLGAVMGSRSCLASVPGGALFLDLGGGSVQMTWVDTNNERYEIDAATAGESMPYGAAKLIRLLEEHPEDVQLMETNKLRDDMKRVYAHLCSRFPALRAIREAYERGEGSHVDVYMCGGGFRGYGSMLKHDDPISPYPFDSINTYAVPGSRFKQTARMLRINKEYAGKIDGVSKRRRQQFSAIVTVVEAFIGAVPNIGWVTFCGGSNMQGAMMMMMPREIREINPLDVLAGVGEHEQPVFDAVVQKLASALPLGVDFSRIPSLFNTGLGLLFVQEVWGRLGNHSDLNISSALKRIAFGNPDSPGLTHLSRAVLALSISSRWGENLNPEDVQLYKSLRAILENRDADAPFWAQYLGGVAGVLATIVPILPEQADEVSRAVSFESRIEERQDEEHIVVLKIDVAAKNARGIDLDNLVDKVNAAANNQDGRKPSMKIVTQIVIHS